MPTARLVGLDEQWLEIVKLACSKPYGKNVTEKGVARIVDNGHLSILEHVSASFDVECSVRVLAQLTRHRHHSFTVKSARGSEFDDMIIPPSIQKYWGDKAEEKKREMLKPYRDAILDGIPFEDAAYLLPEGVKTNMVVTGNLRAWYEWLPKRLCKRAMSEHRELAEIIYKALREKLPLIYDKNFMNCANCKESSCTFK